MSTIKIVDIPEEIQWFFNFEKYHTIKPILSFKEKDKEEIYHIVQEDGCYLVLIPMYRASKQIGYHQTSWLMPFMLEALNSIKKIG